MRSPFTRTALPGEVLMVLVAILWGSAFPVTRLLLEEMPPLAAAAWRTLLAAAGVAAFAPLRGEFGWLRPERWTTAGGWRCWRSWAGRSS